MKKQALIAISIVIIATILLSALLILQTYSLTEKPFHVGVTYCGSSVDEAKQLIDKVKTCTNLFVLQSGPLQENQSATVEICDYAVDNGLDIIVYYGSYYSNRATVNNFLNSTLNRWGNNFLGLYYGDEPGGKMLDGPQVDLWDNDGNALTKNPGSITEKNNGTSVSWSTSGKIVSEKSRLNSSGFFWSYTTYFPNGTIIYEINNNGTLSTTSEQVNLSQYEPYQELWASRPIKEYKDASSKYNGLQTFTLSGLQTKTKTFTSDYGLYWFDYLGGYDVVLAEFGWNHTEAQHMGLVRGAAALQGKSWGAMLTWKFDHEPYMASGEELYDQMSLAHNGGAEYVVVFNYSPNDEGVGVLTDEHYEALERFWNEKVVANGEKAKNVKAAAVLVLPADYGWGMRNPEDTIWGLWQADDKSAQVWSSLQNALEVYDEKLDIVYDDAAFPVSGYHQVLWWNQTI